MVLFAQLFEFEPTPAALAAISIWILVVGSAIGSFLNVVIYRWPRGTNIAHPGSRCPNCNHAIRWYHNLPVCGWLLLRGKCYDCRAPIAVRYPLVEALIAGIFLALAWTDVMPYLGQAGALTPEKIRWAQWIHQCVLLTGLVAAAFIDVDRQRLPWKLWGFVAAVGMGLPLLWPQVRPVHYLPNADWPVYWEFAPPNYVAWLDAAAGLGTALLLAWPATQAPWFQPAERRNAVLTLVWAGLFLGWQPTALLACLTAGTYLVLGAVGHFRHSRAVVPWTGLLALFTLGWLLAWRIVAQWAPRLV